MRIGTRRNMVSVGCEWMARQSRARGTDVRLPQVWAYPATSVAVHHVKLLTVGSPFARDVVSLWVNDRGGSRRSLVAPRRRSWSGSCRPRRPSERRAAPCGRAWAAAARPLPEVVRLRAGAPRGGWGWAVGHPAPGG